MSNLIIQGKFIKFWCITVESTLFSIKWIKIIFKKLKEKKETPTNRPKKYSDMLQETNLFFLFGLASGVGLVSFCEYWYMLWCRCTLDLQKYNLVCVEICWQSYILKTFPRKHESSLFSIFSFFGNILKSSNAKRFLRMVEWIPVNLENTYG